MADRIKGITIEIDGNTTKLSKALEGVNKDIKTTQNSLKDVERLLKVDPGNMELLRQKQELLNQAVGQTAEKLGTLKDALAQMDAAGVDKNTKEYQNLQREIIATENNLKDLKTAAAESNAVLAKITDTSKKVADGAGKVANATKTMSTAAGGALVGLAGLGIKAAQDADELNTLAKQTGFSTDALQKMEYAADLVDVSIEDITGAAKKMKSKMSSNAQAFEDIGVAVKDANGEYRDTETVFYEVIAALGKIENETERDLVAMNLFGKSADELAGIIDDGGQAMKELGQAAEDKGLIISKEDLDQANELNDTLDELKATLAGDFGKAAVSVMKALAPLLEAAAEKVEAVASKLAELDPKTVEIVAIVLAVVAAISPIAGIISGIATAISVIMPIIAAVNAVIAANPIVLIILAIIAAVAALIAIGVLLYKNWDKIKEKATELWGHVTEKFNAIKDGATEKFNAVKDAISGSMEKAKNAAKEKLSAIAKAYQDNGGGIKGTVAATWEGIKQYYKTGFDIVNKLTNGKLADIAKAFKDKFNEIIESAKNWGKNIIEGLVSGITEKWDAIKNALGGIKNAVTSVFSGEEENANGNNSGQVTAQNGNATVESTSAIKSIAQSVSSLSDKNTNVTVVLEGDAKGVFKLVQQQNAISSKAIGRNALGY